MDLIINIVEKKYGKNLIFDNCSFKFSSNLIKIDGKKRSGKSTLLKILSGNTKFKGEIYLENELIKFSDLPKTFVLVDQETAPFDEKTVSYYIDSKKNKEIDDLIIDKFGFSDKLNQKASELSAVWKKKLMILLAFIANPKVILLDEYTKDLDKDFIEKLNDYIKSFSSNHMVIYVDHQNNIYEDKVNISDISNEIKSENSKYVKEDRKNNSKYIKSQLSIFRVVSVVLIIIFSSFIVTACNFNNLSASQDDLWIEFLLDNNLNYIQVDNSFDDETTYSPFYEKNLSGVYEDTEATENISYMTYTDSLDLPIKSEVSVPDDEDIDVACYVTSTHADLLGTTFVLTPEVYLRSTSYLSTTSEEDDDSKTYFVDGVLDINVNNYYNDYLNSIFIEGSTDTYSNEFVYATDDEIEEGLDFVTSARCIDFSIPNAIDNFNIFTIVIASISIVMLIGICVASLMKNKDDNKNFFLLNDSKISVNEFRARRFVYYFITGFLIIIFSFLLGYLEYNIFMNKEYSLTINIVDFNIDIAFLMGIIYIILFIVFDFIFIKNNCDYNKKKIGKKLII